MIRIFVLKCSRGCEKQDYIFMEIAMGDISRISLWEISIMCKVLITQV